ncbi:hypothetical protein ATANTOWER_005831 [Ataeniobius toweri]|uniref:Uncharacterized protein n=1 Tax=Ataeniobius toweri TaxID=208326 RepID=A0ABU7ABR1_9TELE|nr:hypothetical protein [Ataeniobius toweri]
MVPGLHDLKRLPPQCVQQLCRGQGLKQIPRTLQQEGNTATSFLWILGQTSESGFEDGPDETETMTGRL